MKIEGDRQIRRFSKAQIICHWLFAGSFLVLALTGIMVMIPQLHYLTRGGVTRIIHRVAAVIFIVTPFIYFFTDRAGLKALVKESFTYDKDDIQWVMPKNIIKYLFGKAKDMPPSGRLNAGEKFHHAVIILLWFLLVGTGIILLIGRGGGLDPLFYSIVLMLHDLGMAAGMVLTAGHIYFTFVYGALPGMVSGYMPESAAKLEHIKWYNEVKDTHMEEA
jgi:formate dehydrogenase subunit gamma